MLSALSILATMAVYKSLFQTSSFLPLQRRTVTFATGSCARLHGVSVGQDGVGMVSMTMLCFLITCLSIVDGSSCHSGHFIAVRMQELCFVDKSAPFLCLRRRNHSAMSMCLIILIYDIQPGSPIQRRTLIGQQYHSENCSTSTLHRASAGNGK